MPNNIGAENKVLVLEASKALAPAAALSPPSSIPRAIFCAGHITIQTLAAINVPMAAPTII